MLSSREAGWVDWFSSRTVLALGHIADLLSMVFFFWCTKSEVSLVFWTGVFLSPGRRIRVTGKETGPRPGGYG